MNEQFAVENCPIGGNLHGGDKSRFLRLRRLGIDTYREAVIYMREDCSVCRSEGFEAQSRISVRCNSHSIIATLNVVKNGLLASDEVGLSEAAWKLLGAEEGDFIELAHPPALASLGKVRAKIYGKRLGAEDYKEIIGDIAAGRFSDIDTAAFITACAGERLAQDEIINLTKAMIETGERLSWNGNAPIMDKHCIGGLPGNQTTLLVVPIIAAFGLKMPKISSRAITSPAGTADTMETLTNVNLSIEEIKKVVEQEGGCIVSGDELKLNPADNFLSRIEHALEINGAGQMIASVLSKKVVCGATHVVIDIPVGQTAKVSTFEAASSLGKLLSLVGSAVGLSIQTMISDGSQPVGRGIGPALEARDVLAVLKNEQNAPADLRERALILAGRILEMSQTVAEGQGQKIAAQILADGRAWRKFINICEAQGGFREPPRADFKKIITAQNAGIVTAIDNRKLARVAKLAGAPRAQSAGLELHIPVGGKVESEQPLYTIHAENKEELIYALEYVGNTAGIFDVEEF